MNCMKINELLEQNYPTEIVQHISMYCIRNKRGVGHNKKDNLPIEELQLKVEYKNKSNFKKIILGLQKEKLLDLTDEVCKLSPLGVSRVESIINKI